jgi:serine/threonine protein kinase
VKRAVKRLFKKGLDSRQLLLQRQEAVIMKALDSHENVVRLLATAEDEECLYLIMEYCELGKFVVFFNSFLFVFLHGQSLDILLMHTNTFSGGGGGDQEQLAVKHEYAQPNGQDGFEADECIVKASKL